MNQSSVIVYRTRGRDLPSIAPFNPSRRYPEYLYGDSITSSEENFVYDSVRNTLFLSGLDRENFDTPKWNPLKGFIKPGQFVLIKPNLVKEYHPRDVLGWKYVITHGSVIRAVADYVWKALDGLGKVIVADAPQSDSSFAKMVCLLGLDIVQEFYCAQGFDFNLVDLRKEEWTNVEEVITCRRKLPGDPNGYMSFDLAEKSEFTNHIGQGRYYGADYDDGEVNSHHSGGKHEYLVAGSAIKCDVFVNMPKLKTHKKAGITINLKNLVGINGDKNWLPHHTIGSPDNGGDQFPRSSLREKIEHHTANSLRKTALSIPGIGTWLLRKARNAGKTVFGDNNTVIRSGNWYGNDTTWRMCLDLNKIVLYGNSDGTFRNLEPSQRKTYLSFVDGFVAGEGNGPMDPDPVHAGVLLFGSNPALVDAAAAVIMGFDPEKIPVVRQAFKIRNYTLADVDWQSIHCTSNYSNWNGLLGDIFSFGETLHFKPHFGWSGHIERGA